MSRKKGRYSRLGLVHLPVGGKPGPGGRGLSWTGAGLVTDWPIVQLPTAHASFIPIRDAVPSAHLRWNGWAENVSYQGVKVAQKDEGRLADSWAQRAPPTCARWADKQTGGSDL